MVGPMHVLGGTIVGLLLPIYVYSLELGKSKQRELFTFRASSLGNLISSGNCVCLELAVHVGFLPCSANQNGGENAYVPPHHWSELLMQNGPLVFHVCQMK